MTKSTNAMLLVHMLFISSWPAHLVMSLLMTSNNTSKLAVLDMPSYAIIHLQQKFCCILQTATTAAAEEGELDMEESMATTGMMLDGLPPPPPDEATDADGGYVAPPETNLMEQDMGDDQGSGGALVGFVFELLFVWCSSVIWS